MSFKSVPREIRAESADGFTTAVKLNPIATTYSPVRGERVGDGTPLSWVQRSQRWFQREFDEAVASFATGHYCWKEGIAPEDAWRNSSGEIYATIMEGAVTVRWLHVIDSMTAPACWSFYLVDKLAFHASRKLLGTTPSPEVLTAVWQAYQDGVGVGERTGYADGRLALKRELGALLSKAA